VESPPPLLEPLASLSASTLEGYTLSWLLDIVHPFLGGGELFAQAVFFSLDRQIFFQGLW